MPSTSAPTSKVSRNSVLMSSCSLLPESTSGCSAALYAITTSSGSRVPLPSLSIVRKACMMRPSLLSLTGPLTPSRNSSYDTLPPPSWSKNLKRSVSSCLDSNRLHSRKAWANSWASADLLLSSSIILNLRERPFKPRTPRSLSFGLSLLIMRRISSLSVLLSRSRSTVPSLSSVSRRPGPRVEPLAPSLALFFLRKDRPMALL
mmetsp:Transcript_31565/g.62598  ORF Transcript_31565/g.62598 Transcript_31565/m.62598 type:complete len:204 (-) Transcript_31565:1161-1772(-)